ncbi:hypothetical protein DVA67_034605 [Solirubrobacter sp. CPCC 204708]|uniref:Uncharacterized protein n=1 Tax=Solirubrobacter deserti TaxID=2282478 RepID=A0ABT4RVH4_9ACTN|nr:hypothetical protein [Solirubrobacter deserti]MBE2321117.1 hypothetical protein [Solirubrobacter deserti]MDA0142593.1 hypothetical protein [Solirubrobacter deserti]
MTYAPSLRESLQEAAEHRYGRRRRAQRWSAMVLVPAFVAAAAAAVLVAPDPERERTPEPAGNAHTIKVTPLPPRPRAEFLVVNPVPLSRAAGLAAQAKAVNTSASQKRLVRAYAVPGIDGAGVLLTRTKTDVCVSAIHPAAGDFPGEWASACNLSGREHGVGLVVGDTFVGVVGNDGVQPTYKAPNEPAIRLRPNRDGVVVIQGAADGARIRYSHASPETVKIPRYARYQCSDGTSRDMRINNGPITWDPCED